MLPNMARLAFLLLIFISCNKEDSTPASTTIEYRITPMNNAITKITYTNSTGTPTTITNISEFSNGSKTISITSTPFTAKLTTETINTTNATITFTLSILVNNQVKNQTTASVPPIANAVMNSVEYKVE